MNSHNGPDMKLDWNLMRVILAHIESETIKEFLSQLPLTEVRGLATSLG